MFDFEGVDGVFDYGSSADVGRGDNVGDVAVGEAGTWFCSGCKLAPDQWLMSSRDVAPTDA